MCAVSEQLLLVCRTRSTYYICNISMQVHIEREGWRNREGEREGEIYRNLHTGGGSNQVAFWNTFDWHSWSFDAQCYIHIHIHIYMYIYLIINILYLIEYPHTISLCKRPQVAVGAWGNFIHSKMTTVYFHNMNHVAFHNSPWRLRGCLISVATHKDDMSKNYEMNTTNIVVYFESHHRSECNSNTNLG